LALCRASLQASLRSAQRSRALSARGEVLWVCAVARRDERPKGSQAADRRKLCSSARPRRRHGDQGLDQHRCLGERESGQRRLSGRRAPLTLRLAGPPWAPQRRDRMTAARRPLPDRGAHGLDHPEHLRRPKRLKHRLAHIVVRATRRNRVAHDARDNTLTTSRTSGCVQIVQISGHNGCSRTHWTQGTLRTRWRALYGFTGWRFESSRAHKKALQSRGFFTSPGEAAAKQAHGHSGASVPVDFR
jgi:hypothetical protein